MIRPDYADPTSCYTPQRRAGTKPGRHNPEVTIKLLMPTSALVVVQDQVDLKPCGNVVVDRSEELQKLDVAVWAASDISDSGPFKMTGY